MREQSQEVSLGPSGFPTLPWFPRYHSNCSLNYRQRKECGLASLVCKPRVLSNIQGSLPGGDLALHTGRVLREALGLV